MRNGRTLTVQSRVYTDWPPRETYAYIKYDSDSEISRTFYGEEMNRYVKKKRSGWFTLYVTFPFRRGTSPFSKILPCVIKRRCSHWLERLRHVSVPFCRRPRARMFDVMERVLTGLYLLDSEIVNSLTSPPLRTERLLATCVACLCLQKWMKN